MAYAVKYWNLYKDGKVKQQNGLCFSALSTADYGIKMIRYLCPIDERFKDEAVIDFYLDFIRKTFTGRDWTFKKITVKKKRYIHYSLDTSKDWNKYHVLTYLSAFRLLDEAFEIVTELYKNVNEKFNTQFIKFQEIHKDVCDGKINLAKNGLHTLECHGLMYYSSYGGGSCKSGEFNPVEYENFKTRLESQGSESVYKYFAPTSKPKEPAPAPKVEQVVKAADLYVAAPIKPLKPRKPIDKLVKNEAIFA